MDNKQISLTVIIPALDEEKSILEAIGDTLKAFEDFKIHGEIIVIDDGSQDKTAVLVEGLTKTDNRIKLLRHSQPRGVGASFWQGLDNAEGNIVVMIPGDNENDPKEILRYYELLEHVDIIIPFIFNREVRPLFRNALSFLYRFIINTTFLVNFNYTNGTVLYRKSILKELDYRSAGFFFQTDILIRIVKKGYLFAEIPYKINVRRQGLSKAITFPTFLEVVRGYLHLVKDFYFHKKNNSDRHFTQDSLTTIRRQDS